MRVLVVEDNAMDRKLIMEHLQDRGCALVEAKSIGEALEGLDQLEEFDLLVLDVMLSNGTALDLLLHLGNIRNDVPVILTSAAPEHRSLVPNRPLTYWVDKPFRFREFLEVIERAVEAGQSLQTVRRSVGQLQGFLLRNA